MVLKQSQSLIFSEFLNSLKGKICNDFSQILGELSMLSLTALLCTFTFLIQMVMTCTYLVYKSTCILGICEGLLVNTSQFCMNIFKFCN